MRSSRGIYTYLCNGEPSGIEETWQCDVQGDERHLSSMRYARPVGIRLRVDSREIDGQFRNCRLHWRRRLTEAYEERSADYCFDGDAIRVLIHDGKKEIELQESASDYLFSPLMRIYNGPVLSGLCARGGTGLVLVPCIADPEQADQLLRPNWSERQAKLLRETSLHIDGVDMPCREYDYSGGEYPPGTRFWINDDEVMLRYYWQQDRQTSWEVSLSHYELAG